MTILCAGQTSVAAARDQVFPAAFERLTARQTPGISYVIVGVLTSALVIMGQTRGFIAGYKFTILLSTLTAVIPYAFAALAALVLDLHVGNRCRGPGIGLLGVLALDGRYACLRFRHAQ